MTLHRLLLNDNKTEVFVITTQSSASERSLTDIVTGVSIFKPTTDACNLRVMFDSVLSIKLSYLCQ